MTEEEKIICKQFLNDADKTHSCNEYKLLMALLEQESKTFKWCTDCREYNQEKHCCHRWSKVIRDTVEEMKQEPTLSIDDVMSVFDDFMCGEVDENGTEEFLEMLKDKAESEG